MLFENMSKQAQEELTPHAGHSLIIAFYGDEVSIECIPCGQTLITFQPDPEVNPHA